MADDAYVDKVKIVNWALAELGLAPSFTIDSNNSLGATVDIFWPRAIGRCFGLHDWTFCRKTFRLDRLADTPATGFRHAFSMPGERLGAPLRLLSDPRSQSLLRHFRIEGDEIHVDENDLYAVFKVPRAPESWDWSFASAFATALASYLAVPLMQDDELAAVKAVEAFGSRSEGGAGGVFGRLIAQDRAGEPLGAPQPSDMLNGGRNALPWHGRW